MKLLSIFVRNKKFNYLNLVFLVSIALFLPIIFGILQREWAFLILVLYLGFILFSPLKSGVELFLRSIPFFIALPITETFDNFNIWRILILLIFIKWFFVEYNWRKLLDKNLFDRMLFWVKKNKVEFAGIMFFVFAALSILVALDTLAAVKRLIFLLNATMLFVVIRSLVIKNRDNIMSFAKNFAYSGLLVVGFGYLQFIAAYFVPAWIFHYWWGQVVSINMYGATWGDIVTNFGNTWFSYSGDTLRLRMFSTFPDSHSFPMYVIMTLPSIVLIFLNKYKIQFLKFKELFVKYRMLLVTFVLIMLALILTGTRGIWLAILPAFFVTVIFKFAKVSKKLIASVVLLSLLFLAMFPVYFGIVSFRQFQDSDFTGAASLQRIRSVIDFGETSNEARIYIWKTTITYIKKSPVFGIGIGNYPIILKEPQSAALAGASAHNLYLDIAATMGIFALIAFLWMLWDVFIKGIKYLKRSKVDLYSAYVSITLFSLVWVFAYLMTDAALFDGRALLGFMAVLGIIVPVLKNPKKE